MYMEDFALRWVELISRLSDVSGGENDVRYLFHRGAVPMALKMACKIGCIGAIDIESGREVRFALICETSGDSENSIFMRM